jgi:signal transduction histidine kinase
MRAGHGIRATAQRKSPLSLSIRGGVTLGFSLAFAILAVVGAVSYRSTVGLVETGDRVAHTQEVLTALQSTLAAVGEAETGVRGYVITGEESFLGPYHAGRRGVEQDLKALRALIAGDAGQRQRLDRLMPLVEASLRELGETVTTRRERGYGPAVELVRLGEGKRLMDEARALIREMETEERTKLARRTERARADADWTLWIIKTGTALAVAVIIVAILIINRQIARRQKAEAATRGLNAALEQRIAALDAANAELDAFTYSVSHDLRAPLRSMQGFSVALLEDYGDRFDETGRDYARRIVVATRRMDDLIHDLLTYSRLGRAELSLGPVSTESVLDEALAQIDGEIKERGAQVTVERPLPRLVAHRATLSQILTNLLANAVKFVAPGTAPRVTVRAEPRDEWVRLWVEDNGIGVAPQHHERIFRAFERLHGLDTYAGTGIGLAIVQKGVARLGGQAGVESEPGRGSRFWVELRSAEGRNEH